MGKFLVAAASALAFVSAAGHADAALVVFSYPPFPETVMSTFADGVFGNDQRSGGFWIGDNKYSGVVYNKTAPNQYIRFNGPVTLNSFTINRVDPFDWPIPISFSINLYDIYSVLISSTLVHTTSTPGVVKLDQSGVQKVEFSYLGTPGSDIEYQVSNVSYDLGGGVPEPAVWSLMIGGFSLVGASLRRRRPHAA